MSINESDECRNCDLRRFIDQPMSRAGDNLAFYVGRYQLGLIDEKSPAGFLAGQYKYRDGQRRRAHCGEVLRILFKVAEVLEAGTHAARLRVSFRIELPVGFGDGMFRVG